MPRPLNTYSAITALCLIVFSTSCILRKPNSLPPLELKLFVGVDKVVRLNDTEAMVGVRAGKLESKKLAISELPDLQELNFTGGVHFPDVGIRAYFRAGRVALIETQEPFNGSIHGRTLKVFPLAKPPGATWEETLVHEFGEPSSRVSGGRFGSEALFYSWGDISYNGVGPNQIALYRDPKIANYRQKNFGRILRLFPSNP